MSPVGKRDCPVDLVKRFGTFLLGRVLPATPDPRQDRLDVGLPVHRRVGKAFESVDGAPVVLGRLPASPATLGFRRRQEPTVQDLVPGICTLVVMRQQCWIVGFRLCKRSGDARVQFLACITQQAAIGRVLKQERA